MSLRAQNLRRFRRESTEEVDMATGGLGHILTVPPRISIDVVERKQRGKSMSCDTSLTITNLDDYGRGISDKD